MSLPFRPLAAVVAGAAGGLALLAVETVAPRWNAFEVSAERAAADVLRGGTRTPAVRYAVPIAVGGVFALGYAWLWSRGRLGPGVAGVATLGVLHGLATIPTEPVLRTVHVGEWAGFPPARTWVPGVVLDHVAYALATATAYRALSSLSH